VAVTKGRQQADTGTKMIHLGKNTSSTIVSKGISASTAAVLPRAGAHAAKAEGARNHTQCDSAADRRQVRGHTFPYIEVKNPSAKMEHEATTSKISDDQLFYCRSRGLSEEDAVSMIVNGFCKEVFNELPMEFAVEAQKLLSISLEGASADPRPCRAGEHHNARRSARGLQHASSCASRARTGPTRGAASRWSRHAVC
jgi:Fe-S cluster assembly protein SufB